MLISRCEVWQCSQMQPGVRVRENCRSRCYPVIFFHILLLLLLLLLLTIIIIIPTKFLHTSSAWHRTPTYLIHTQGNAEVSEPVRTLRWWHSHSYSVRGNAKFVPPMYKHTPMPPFCYGTVYIHVSSREASHILHNGGTFFYVEHIQHFVAKPRIAS